MDNAAARGRSARRFGRRLTAVVAAISVPAAGLAAVAGPARAADPSIPVVANPPIEDSCGLDVTLTLDASGSISSSGAVEDVRKAARDFLDSLVDTNSTARVTQFATVSEELAPPTNVDGASVGPGGALGDAVADYYNPKPPRPSNVDLYRYDGGGDPLEERNYSMANDGNQYTNWDQGLDQAGEGGILQRPELVIFLTDGDPTGFDFDQAGDPFDQGPPPDVAHRTDRGAAEQVTLDRSVEEANQLKSDGTRMLAIGVGEALQNPNSVDRLEAISGPQLVTDLTTVDSINEIDVALVEDFEDLAEFLRLVVLELCSPSLTIRKLAQTPEDPNYTPQSGWDMTVTPSAPGGFEWILPTPGGPPPDSKSDTTDNNGFAQFQWEPSVGGVDSSALVEEELQPGYIAGRPNGDDWVCVARDETGNSRTVTGEFDITDPTMPSFTLDPIGNEIVTCTLYNSFDFQPEIELTKQNTPAELRGDLTPPAQVTSQFVVTNPGNTPLSNITVLDNQCSPAFVSGDTNSNGLLDPLPDPTDPTSGEQWIYECTRPISTAPSTDPAGQTIVNDAEVTGLDPRGTPVTDFAEDDVVAFNPAISLDKTVSEDLVEPGDPVTYTFTVNNTGNTPLGTITLTDVPTPANGCAPEFTGGDTNGDSVLDLTETWTYECTATINADTVNVATVAGTPLNPEDDNQPFPDPNPVVTDTDDAVVKLNFPALFLTKSVDKTLIFPGTEVTYTYEAFNPPPDEDAPIRPDLVNPDPNGNPGWVTDDTCSPVQMVMSGGFNVGDTNQDNKLNPGETWQFTCTTTITQDTLNTAEIVAQVDGDDETLTRTDIAVVNVIEADIAIVKQALRPVVLDPDADPIPGSPDSPQPRPAQYIYEVTNPGDAPLKDVVVTDDKCSPLVFQGGDDGNDGFLEPGEVWTYSCQTTLEREQGTPPPLGDGSANVINTATVTGTPFIPGDPDTTDEDVTDQYIANVLVIEPGIDITKTASQDVVLVGTSVLYTIEVTNTGDVGLQLVGPTDDKCDPLEYQSGDDNGNNLLDGANSGTPETWVYTCARTLDLPTPPGTTDINTAQVLGFDPLGNGYAAQDTAQVEVIDPAIDLTKAVSQNLVPVGTEVTYTYEVRNVGNSPVPADDLLADIQLTDVANPVNRECLQPELVAKTGGNQDDFLDREPAEVWIYECPGTILQETTNVAGVGGTGGTQFGLEVFVVDFDAAFVQPFDPQIDIVKTAEPTQFLGGGEVTYTYEVTNPGDVPLADVASRITDDTCSPVTYVSGDTDGDGLLDTDRSIFEDAEDETWIFTCTTTVTEDTTNIVDVTGTPTDSGGEPLCVEEEPNVADDPAAAQDGGSRRVVGNCDVTDRDEETVTVILPATIIVEKQTDPAGAEGTFSFTGDAAGSIGDGEQIVVENLPPGQYTATEADPGTGFELASIRCDDTDSTGDLATGTATFNVSEGETVTCVFRNMLVPPPQPPVTPETGARGIGATVTLALAVLVLGATLVLVARTRRLGQ